MVPESRDVSQRQRQRHGPRLRLRWKRALSTKISRRILCRPFARPSYGKQPLLSCDTGSTGPYSPAFDGPKDSASLRVHHVQIARQSGDDCGGSRVTGERPNLVCAERHAVRRHLFRRRVVQHQRRHVVCRLGLERSDFVAVRARRHDGHGLPGHRFRRRIADAVRRQRRPAVVFRAWARRHLERPGELDSSGGGRRHRRHSLRRRRLRQRRPSSSTARSMPILLWMDSVRQSPRSPGPTARRPLGSLDGEQRRSYRL